MSPSPQGQKINEFGEIIPDNVPGAYQPAAGFGYVAPASATRPPRSRQTIILAIVSSLLGLLLTALGGFFWYSGFNAPAANSTAATPAAAINAATPTIAVTATPSADELAFNAAFDDLFGANSESDSYVLQQLPSKTVPNLENLTKSNPIFHTGNKPDAVTLLFIAYYKVGVKQSQVSQGFADAPKSFKNAQAVGKGNPTIEKQVMADLTLLPKNKSLSDKPIATFQNWLDDTQARYDAATLYSVGNAATNSQTSDWKTAIANWSNLYKTNPLYLSNTSDWVALRLYDAYRQYAAQICGGSHDAAMLQLKAAAQLVSDNKNTHPLPEPNPKVDDLITKDSCS